jgi:hypothetical protein
MTVRSKWHVRDATTSGRAREFLGVPGSTWRRGRLMKSLVCRVGDGSSPRRSGAVTGRAGSVSDGSSLRVQTSDRQDFLLRETRNSEPIFGAPLTPASRVL